MKLKDILNNIDYEVISGDVLVDVKDIAYNSKNVKEGFMFVALTGFMVDGHKYIEDAINNGAKV